YITEINVQDLGPIASFLLKPRLDSSSNPVPVVLVGRNGSGKSILLSVLMDAFVEAKKKAWRRIPEIPHDKYLRVQSKAYVRTGCDYSLVAVKFANDDATRFEYDEVVSRLEADAFRNRNPAFRVGDRDMYSTPFAQHGFFKECKAHGDVRSWV